MSVLSLENSPVLIASTDIEFENMCRKFAAITVVSKAAFGSRGIAFKYVGCCNLWLPPTCDPPFSSVDISAGRDMASNLIELVDLTDCNLSPVWGAVSSCSS